MIGVTFPERETEENADLSEDVVDEGVQLINEFFQEWLEQEQKQDDGDVDMTDGTRDPEESIRRLKEQVEKFAPRLEGNPWLRNVIASL